MAAVAYKLGTILLLYCLTFFGNIHRTENAVIHSLEKGGDAKAFDWDEPVTLTITTTTSTTQASTYNFVWRVTATGPFTSTVNRGYTFFTFFTLAGPKQADRDIIMDAVHETLIDYNYRYMWLSLMRHSYKLFMQEFKLQGHQKFIKPNKNKKNSPFEGPEGEKRWEFLLDYFGKMDLAVFEKLIEMFDYDRAQMDEITKRTYSTFPLPEDYFNMTDPTFWKKYTEDENASFFDPWKYTVPLDHMNIDPNMFPKH